MPTANPQDDIRGIGAALYALLVNRWPLPERGAPSGLAPADRDAAGLPVEPTVVDRDIPFQVSAVAVRAVQENGGIRSASTLLNLLQQATAVADRTEILGPIDDSPPPAPREPTGREHAVFARRRRNVLIGISVALAVIVVGLVVLASVVSSIFGNVGGGLNKDELGLNGPSSSTSSAVSSAPAGSVIRPTKATVFTLDGDPDNEDQAKQAIDGDPSTSWSTELYSDAVPFPTYKKGEGLMLQLPKPTVVGQLNIDISSTGTNVEIRSSPTPTPSQLNDTTVLATTTLKQGHNTIPVKSGAPTSNLLVWISTLGSTNGKSQASISEISVQAAS
jgi:putative peptidoglycan lipid II flippase